MSNAEESAHYVKSLWKSLLVADWSPDDLIELGKVVYARCALADLSNEVFGRLLPHLTKVASHLGNLLYQRPPEAIPSRDEIAFLIRAIWASLCSPVWPRADLIELGRAVHNRTTLTDMDQQLYERLLPRLVPIADMLRNLVNTRNRNTVTLNTSQPPSSPSPTPETPVSAPTETTTTTPEKPHE